MRGVKVWLTSDVPFPTSWSEDRFASTGLDHRLRIWDPSFEKELFNLDLARIESEYVDWSPGGKMLLTAGAGGSVVLDARSAYSD